MQQNQQDIMISVRDVKKQYRLGQIGGGTLRGDLQSWWARKRGKEDPNTLVGTDQRLIGTTFMALNGVSFTVKKGEALGIIGANGAGKSTLLKLLTHVTAPSEGDIDIYGRVASMLEVGTGFHPEMTGRENIYMNGAILGMTREEIDAKMEQIIDFSEVREFIDTPVKRYSSGMYVKLAFSVAAHLDSEIMIMDEVLAVGDIKFQQKCLTKMQQAAREQGRTVLYVSHNMNTIRQLCDRCIVLDKGKIVYDGDVEQAIVTYLGGHALDTQEIDLAAIPRESWFSHGPATMEKLHMRQASNQYLMDTVLQGCLTVSCREDIQGVLLTCVLLYRGTAVTSFKSLPNLRLYADRPVSLEFSADLGRIAPAEYTVKLVLSRLDEFGNAEHLDVISDAYEFEILQRTGFNNKQKWRAEYGGFLTGSELEVRQNEP